jgi:tRNA 2-selenouridine synthase SelU
MVQSSRERLEAQLQAEFPTENNRLFTSTAVDPKEAENVKSLIVPLSERGRMPLSLEKFVLDEPPARVEWERQVRIYLGALPNPEAGHRITAPMVFEWTTGKTLKQIREEEGIDMNDPDAWRGGAWNGSANTHLRWINWVLKEYFGDSYKTRIAGRDVGKAYTVRQYFRIREKMPANLTLWPDWNAGTLLP